MRQLTASSRRGEALLRWTIVVELPYRGAEALSFGGLRLALTAGRVGGRKAYRLSGPRHQRSTLPHQAQYSLSLFCRPLAPASHTTFQRERFATDTSEILGIEVPRA